MSRKTIIAAIVAVGLAAPVTLLSAAPAQAATYQWDRYNIVTTTTYTQGSWTAWVQASPQATSKSGYPNLQISASSGFSTTGTYRSITKANAGVLVYSSTATKATAWQYTSSGTLWTCTNTATVKTTQSKGSTSYGPVTSTSSTTYPQNGPLGSYWYVSRGPVTPVKPTVTVGAIGNTTVGSTVTVSASSSTPCYRMAAKWQLNGGPDNWLGEVYSASYSKTFTPKVAGTYTVTVYSRSYIESDARSDQGSASRTFTVSNPTYTFTLSQTGNYAFPRAVAGYAAPTARSVTVTNTGNVAGTFAIAINSANFALSRNTTGSLAAGASIPFTVVPKMGLPAGNYSATITVTGSPANFSYKTFTVSFEVVNPIHTFSLSQTGNYAFPKAVVGYATPTARSVTVTNTGNVAGTFAIAINSANFTLSRNTTGSLAAGASIPFTVVPKTGLPAGNYSATITVTGSPASFSYKTFTVSFEVVNPIHTFSLTPAGNHTFPQAVVGYAALTARTMTVTNTGNVPGTFSITSSNLNFLVSRATTGSLSPNTGISFSVAPKLGLGTGTHTSTITVSGTPYNFGTKTFTVSFTVGRSPNLADPESIKAYVAQLGGINRSMPANVYQTFYGAPNAPPKGKQSGPKNRYSNYVFTKLDALNWLIQTGGNITFVLQKRDVQNLGTRAEMVESSATFQADTIAKFKDAKNLLANAGLSVAMPKFYIGAVEQKPDTLRNANGEIGIYDRVLQLIGSDTSMITGAYFGEDLKLSDDKSRETATDVAAFIVGERKKPMMIIPYFTAGETSDQFIDRATDLANLRNPAKLGTRPYFSTILLQPGTFYQPDDSGRRTTAVNDLIKFMNDWNGQGNATKIGIQVELDMGLVTGRSDENMALSSSRKKTRFNDYLSGIKKLSSDTPMGIYSGGPNEQGYADVTLNANEHNTGNHRVEGANLNNATKGWEYRNGWLYSSGSWPSPYAGNLIYDINNYLFRGSSYWNSRLTTFGLTMPR
ncbi:MAG: hypothetical protein FWD59_07105 [Micrococcales bacterium]|nr:hypothetical protein [Micrococcales bacterium]